MRKYTVGVNHTEYMQGLYDTEKRAIAASLKLLAKFIPQREIDMAEAADELHDLLDGYGFNIIEIYI